MAQRTEFNGASYLSHNLKISLSGHVWVGPCVHGNIVSLSQGLLELGRVPDNVAPDHEMGRALVVRLQE